MQTEKALSQKFIQYLKEHGYPEESIVCEWKIGNYRVDLAIIDIQTKKVMAIYEFKNSNYKNSNIVYNQMVKFLDEIGDYTIPAYIVYDYDNEYGFSVKKIEINNEKNIGNDIPNYKILQNSFNNGYIIQKQKEKEKVKDKLNIVCIIMSVLVTIVLILDLLGYIDMTTNRIILLGTSIGLFIFPFAKSIKILGIEVERKNTNK